MRFSQLNTAVRPDHIALAFATLISALSSTTTAYAQDASSAVDTDGDRVADTTFYDTNRDGNPERAVQDMNANGIHEREYQDPAELGQWTALYTDLDDNGSIDEYWFDDDADGFFDRRTTLYGFGGEGTGMTPMTEFLPSGVYPVPTSPRPAGASDDGASEGTIWDVLDAIAAAREAAESTEDELYTGDERVDETSVETASSVPIDERQCDGETRYWSMYSRFDMDVFVDAETWDEAKVKCAKWLIEHGTPDPDYDTVECPDDCPPGATGCEIVPMSSDTYTADDGRFYCPKASEDLESSVVYWTCSECVADDCPGAGDSSDASSETVGTDTPMEESPSAGMDTDLSGNPFIDHDYNGRFNAGDERVSLTTEIDSGGDVISIYRGTGKMIIPKTTPTPCGEADPALVFEAEDILVRKRMSCTGSVGFVAEDMLRIRTGRDQSIGGDLDIRARRMVAQDTAIDGGTVSIRVDGKLDLSGTILMAQGSIVLSGKSVKLLEATVWSEDDWVDINATGAHINLRDLLVSDAALQTCHTLSGACPDAVYVRWANLDAGLFTIDGVCPTDAGGLTFVGEAGGYSCASE